MFGKVLRLLCFLSALAPFASPAGPKVTVVKGRGNPDAARHTQYIWKKFITCTVFWIGEKPTANNPTPNNKSSWDQEWMQNYGGFDDPDPDHRNGFLPRSFTPKLNPFYVALPYNDVQGYRSHKPEAKRVIPWFGRQDVEAGETVCRGRWVQIYSNGKYCYAQWEDCGPFTTDDWEYVFGKKKPKNKKNDSAGIDISPAVRDYLGLANTDKVHWRFVEFSRVPKGPWAELGTNNPFVNEKLDPDARARQDYMERLRQERDRAYMKKDIRRNH